MTWPISRRFRKRFLWGLLLLISCWIFGTAMPGVAQEVTAARGQQLLQNERYAEAAQVWQNLVKHSQQASSPGHTAIALNYLAIAEQQLSHWEAAQTAIDQGLQTVNTLPAAADTTAVRARLLNTAGQQAWLTGQVETAVEFWRQAAAAYAQIGDETGQIGSQINQAIALQSLGFYRRSKQQLEGLHDQIQRQPLDLRVLGLQQLGIAYRKVGQLVRAREVLESALQQAEPVQVAAIYLSLGNVLRDLQEPEAAIHQYRRVAHQPKSKTLLGLKAEINQLQILVDIAPAEAGILAARLESQVMALPPSRSAVFTRVNYVQSLMKLAEAEQKRTAGVSEDVDTTILQHLRLAVAQSSTLRDQRAEALSLGTLGSFYEHHGDWEGAQALTQRALALANGLQAEDLVARWQWQLGRIAKQQANSTRALSAYEAAVQALQNLREDLAAVSDLQYSFTQRIEPVYRELVQLLLTSPPEQPTLSQARLRQALQVLENLKLRELDNFFHQACLQATPQEINDLDPDAAIVYPIILPDRLAVILARPQAPLTYYETQLPQAKILSTIDKLQMYLNPVFLDSTRLQLSQTLYDWILRPAQADLASQGVKTLVFVLDGPLKNLPMAALHDGQRYLIESYRVAVAPSLALIDPQQLEPQSLGVLAAGLSQPQLDFPALPAVEEELQYIEDHLPGSTLLNAEFTTERLKEQTNRTRFPILHLATHGQFGSTTEDTFLVTWNGLLDAEALAELILGRENPFSQPIELLILSACQTATGDTQSALGLSGVATRSGARSTIGTLWQVGDQSTATVMAEFYQALNQSARSRAEALQQAQLKLLADPDLQHPYYWSPYVLIGNWL